MHILEHFGVHSGYKLNISQTQILMFYCSPNEELEELKLNWKAKSIQYLCIRITKKDIEKWSTYPLSLTERIKAGKMNILPV